MKKPLILFVFLFIAIGGNCQTLYSKAYGNPKNEPLIFLHGGPGYNSVAFELTTAQELSEHGFYVIVYDRRGEGRSKDQDAAFTFHETNEDLDAIYKQFKLTKATLIGHSFGGIVGALYAEKNPTKVKSIVLVAAPLSMQETFSTILKSSKKIYTTNQDRTNLGYIEMLEKMDKTSLEFSSYCFTHAMQNGFYMPKEPSKEAISIYNDLKMDTSFGNTAAQMTFEAPTGFWQNENYTSIDLSKNLSSLVKKEIPLFGMYGIEDGLYGTKQISQLKKIIPSQHFKYIENCSHNVFIDQQDQFIKALKNWIKNDI